MEYISTILTGSLRFSSDDDLPLLGEIANTSERGGAGVEMVTLSSRVQVSRPAKLLGLFSLLFLIWIIYNYRLLEVQEGGNTNLPNGDSEGKVPSRTIEPPVKVETLQIKGTLLSTRPFRWLSLLPSGWDWTCTTSACAQTVAISWCITLFQPGEALQQGWM